MGAARSIAVTALVGGLLLAGGVPAYADGTEPLTVTSTGLTDGQYIHARQIIHPAWTGSAEVVKIQVAINGATGYTYTSWTHGVAVPTGISGQNEDIDVTVRVFDADGNEADATTAVHLDETYPKATFTPTPFSYVGGVVTVTATDVSDDAVEVALVDPDTYQEVVVATDAPWTLRWDTVAFPQRLRPAVIDRAGNVTRYDGYRVDNTAPVVSDLTYYSDIPGRVHGGTYLGVGLTDTSGVNHLEWWVDGALASARQATGSNNISGDLLKYNFGTTERISHIEVRAWDRTGNEGTRAFDVTVDATGPTVVSATPANGKLVRGARISGTITATDPSGVLDAILTDLSNSDKDLNSDFEYGAHTITASVSAGPDGRHNLSWRVDDNFGNETTITRYVIIDNTKPNLAITQAPKNGAKVHGTVTVTASATDRNGINRVQLIVNGKVVATDTTAGYRFTINTSKYGKKIKIQLRAYDKAGNATLTATRIWHR